MSINYRAELVGVFGCPVDENPSVVMNEAAFDTKGLNWRYISMHVEPEDLKSAFDGLRATNFQGVNLTIPHKQEAMKYVDEISDSAKLIGAINFVKREGNKLIADNTDGAGMISAFKDNDVDLKDKRMVVLGAGGASRAICVESALAGCSEIYIFNRTVSKAEEIAEIINNNTDCKAIAGQWLETLHIPDCDIFVNATSIGLYPDKSCPDIYYDDITPHMFVQDVIPNPPSTLFIEKAREQGARTSDGLSMLVQQGAIGFQLWTGEDAPVDVMKKALEDV